MALDEADPPPPPSTSNGHRHTKGLVAEEHHYPPSTPHLNPHNLLILSHQSRGRGVYASKSMSAGTLLEISPVLVFEPEEWRNYGCKTVLDSYTFKWSGMGAHALALGLGSLFNHSPHPSVSFTLDRPSHSIRYTLVRDVVAGEELCISYGPWGKQYESTNGNVVAGESDAAADETDEEQRCSRDLDDMLRIGQERGAEGSGAESEASGSSPRRQLPKRRTRTRYTGASGSTAAPALASASASSSSAIKDQQQQSPASLTPQPPRRTTTRLTTPPPSIQYAASCVSSHPIWRLTSLPDPATIPLTLIPCWALTISPTSSSSVLPFLRKHSRVLGRGPQLGGEEDPLRHAKTLSRRQEDGGKLRALVCPQAALSEEEVRSLAERGFAAEAEVVKVNVASSAAPLKERAGEWCASWPVAFRSVQATAPVVPAPPPTTAAAATSPPQAGAAATNGSRTNTGTGTGTGTGSGTDSPTPAPVPAPSPSPQPPNLFVDRRADCAFWSPPRTAWVIRKLARCVLTAMSASSRGELPIAVHICPSILPSTTIGTSGGGGGGPDGSAHAPLTLSAAATTAAGWDVDGLPLEGGEAIEVDAADTRVGQRNPIKHAVGNAVSRVAEIRAERRAAVDTAGAIGEGSTAAAEYLAATSSTGTTRGSAFSSSGSGLGSGSASGFASPSASASASASASGSRPDSPSSAFQPPLLNGQDYLLTSLTLFTTHEPCIYCSMSLVHSRVRHVVLLTPSPRGSGGCCGSQLPESRRCAEDGGPYALHEQRGLNHRFEVWRWRGGLDVVQEEVRRISGEKVDVADLLDLAKWGRAVDP
ncbi:hypothetical protein BDZ90DRAFT_282157 [Jaminaea rosea]|uniref:SET domain-containing protein n=1 Tax=Jaminaea rosea TaxID=1569628 RepID=A0A316UHZ9_9BASI|nr:hypothetical protein BDZ90DRAFT_282157 [Jaminaea rosea]PWN24839.1 hypothetical protein BDZ90DRAFT_282157 [Jaminaea rosea]